MSDKSCPHCGGSLESGRSSPDHNRLFGLIRAALQQWPENHRFQPDNYEHLRAWLIAQAGHRTVQSFEMPASLTEADREAFLCAIEGTMRAMDGHGWTVMHNGAVHIIRPKSIAWHKLGQREFGQLRDAVTEIIEAIIEVPADQLLRERAA